ncbi:MAG: hypothetical protein EOM40_08915 [Clostridia bacterium]|nr:hypothetical protein [Clostridia bacterium]
METFNEFVYSIVRRWRLICIGMLLLGIIFGAFYVSSVNVAVEKEAEIAVQSWDEADKIYLGKLKYVGIGNETINSEVVRDTYYEKATSVDLIKKIRDEFFTEFPLNYVESLILVNTKNLNNCLEIEVVYYDEKICSEMCDSIESYLEKVKSELVTAIGEHNLLLLEKSDNNITEDKIPERMAEIKSIYATISNGDTVGQNFSIKKM